MLSETGDMSMTVSSNVLVLDSRSSVNKSMIWANFLVNAENDRSIKYERMSS